MTAPTTMPTFAPEPRPRSRPSGWIVEEGGDVILLAISVVAAEVVGEDTEGRNVEVEAKEAEAEANEVEVEVKETEFEAHQNDENSTELFGIVPKELENLFNWSSGVA